MTRHADQAYHDRIAASFDEAYDRPGGRAYTQAFTRRILAEASVQPDGRVLDLGCGTGRFAIEIAAQSGASVVGVDQAAAMVRLARRNARRAALDSAAGSAGTTPAARAQFLQGGAAAIPLASASVDLVVCFGVLHHTVGEGDPTAQDVLREAARVLRPAGRLVVVEPNAWNPYFFATTWIWPGLQQRVAGYPRVEHERPLTRRFLRRALAQAGLQVQHVATASPLEAFRGPDAGPSWRLAQRILEGPLRPLGTHVLAVAVRREA